MPSRRPSASLLPSIDDPILTVPAVESIGTVACFTDIGCVVAGAAGATGVALDLESISNTCEASGGPAGANCNWSLASTGAELASRQIPGNPGQVIDLLASNGINLISGCSDASPTWAFGAGSAV
jgi:hypothetical protein